jgi:hypothetical protein
MREYPESDAVVRGIVVAIALVTGVVTWFWWRSYTQDREAKRGAMPGCIARLGSKDACDQRFDDYHRQCFAYTNKPAGKFTPREFNAAAYLDCIVVGPEDWARTGRDARARERRRDKADGMMR